jgi:hypothetical protein
MRSAFLLAFAFVSLLVACGPMVSAERIGRPVRPMRPKAVEDVALVTQKPDYPFVEVALLRIQDSDYDWSHGTLLQKLRAHGAKLGCDAVIVLGTHRAGELFNRNANRTAHTASCIQYTDPN